MTGDMTKYDELVYDNAGMLAQMIGDQGFRAQRIMRAFILRNGGDPAAFLDLIPAIQQAADSEAYLLENYREFVADEGVVEAIKDVMRRLFGYES